MRNSRKYLPAVATVGAMIALILDSKTAIMSTADAVTLCIQTAIPSLFPFFVLSGYLVPYASGLRIPWLQRVLQVPSGCESIFLLGCIGGYPVGTHCTAQSYVSGNLSKQQAERMLGFCTNCGPAFMFGIVAAAFTDPWAPFAAMIIGILSAAVVGALWPCVSESGNSMPDVPAISLPQAVQQALRSMASVCAWIILGKILLVFVQKWVLWLFPQTVNVFLNGLLELTNGCLTLCECENEGLRFLIACVFCSFGGLCVAMQAFAICNQANLNPKHYLPQKALQAGIAAILAAVYWNISVPVPLRMGVITGICYLVIILCKKTVEISSGLMYNKVKKGGI